MVSGAMSSREGFIFDFERNLSDKSFVNYFSDDGTGFAVSFVEFNNLCSRLQRFLSAIVDDGFQYVALYMSDYVWLPCFLLSIWKMGHACACMGTQYAREHNAKFLNDLRVKYVIADVDSFPYDAVLVDAFSVNHRRFYVWRTNARETPLPTPNSDICYGIMSSGSTGAPKIIQVPWSCILPNVEELASLLDIKNTDNIYLSSPCTFDPFFVELFASMLTGCTLTIVSFKLKLCSEALVRILFKGIETLKEEFDVTTGEKCFCCPVDKIADSRITFLQMTPSVFKRWSASDISGVILSDDSPLRVLLLGGEKFPKEILKLKSKCNRTRIYNVYGITEISCWAFISDDASLGVPLNDIKFRIDENGEFHIGSQSRKCLVDNEQDLKSDDDDDDVVYRRTGDVVLVENKKIYHVGRTKELVKKYGITINLKSIEEQFLVKNKELRQCCCVFDESAMKIAVFCVNESLKNDYKILSPNGRTERVNVESTISSMATVEKPDYVVEIQKVPLSSNGKCDAEALLERLRRILKETERGKGVEEILKEAWTDVVNGESFSSSGADSVKALQLVTRLEEAGVHVPGDFLVTLLGDGDYDKCLNCLVRNVERRGHKRLKLESDDDIFRFIVKWKFDTGKCVDATPTILDREGADCVAVVVGSHSSKLSSVDVETGRENWSISLGDRIESGTCVDRASTFGVIGSYDRHVYCVSISNGNVIWKHETQGMVKSTPCLSSDEASVYVASYDTYLYCLSCADGALIKKLKLSRKGVFSSGVKSDELRTLYIATLEGTAVCLNQNTNTVKWKKLLSSPVFASPCLAAGTVVFAEVTGHVHCLNASTGEEVWHYKCPGNLYSSPVASSGTLFFGCHDSCLYCLEATASLKWRIPLDSPVFARPCPFRLSEDDLVAVATTKGWIYLCDAASGAVVARFRLGGEVFSSPVVNGRNILVGCRDDNLYCLQMVREPPNG